MKRTTLSRIIQISLRETWIYIDIRLVEKFYKFNCGCLQNSSTNMNNAWNNEDHISLNSVLNEPTPESLPQKRFGINDRTQFSTGNKNRDFAHGIGTHRKIGNIYTLNPHSSAASTKVYLIQLCLLF